MKKIKKRGRVRKAARYVAAGGKTTLLEVGIGALVGYGQEAAESKVAFLRSKPWMTSAVLIGAGHFLKRKSRTRKYAPSLVAVGGMLLGRYFKTRGQTQTAGLDTGLVVRHQFAAQQSAPALVAPSVVAEVPMDDDAEADAGLVMRRISRIQAA